MIEIELSDIPFGVRVEASGKGAEVELLLRDFVEDVAQKAAASFRRKVPIGDTFRTWESVGINGPFKTATGQWRATAGVGPIEKLKPGESPNYPIFVHEGTGLFRKNNPGLIYPQHGNVMVFEVDGQTIFTRYTQGQPAQPYIQEVQEETERYMRLKKRELAALINNLL